jgi:ribosomal protein S12 methylthiotransferase
MARVRDLPVFPLAPEPVRPGVSPGVAAVRLHVEPTGAYAGTRFALMTLGCDKNTVDSERIMAALVGSGAQVSSEIEGADVVLINTCGFIQASKEQSIETILEACRLKDRGDIKAVVAVGCMVERYAADLRTEIPEVDLYLGLQDLQGLVPELRKRGLLRDPSGLVPAMERPLRILASETPHTSYLKISEGCDHSCAFCAIPLMRGLHRSHPLDELVQEAAGLAARGVREINIVSQDTTWYGRDLARGSRGRGAPLLPDLLRALVADTDVPWYRLFYMYPSGITREVVELMAAEPRILPYLDMPIQHGSDRVLQLMRRPERRKTILERVAWLREAVPDLTLRTTVIVGFPGEADNDFRDMLDLLAEVGFDRVGAFAYSREEGTRAADMEGHICEAEKQERLEEVMELQRGISFDKNLALVGRTCLALVDARTVGQALEVDGVTNLRPGADVTPGEMLLVEIVDALDYDLIGEVRR